MLEYSERVELNNELVYGEVLKALGSNLTERLRLY